jgi:hypothetical protein
VFGCFCGLDLLADRSRRAIEHQVQKNLDPSLMSPYTSIDEYQRFASALVLSTSTPPKTRVADDGMQITYGEHTLDVQLWRKALADLVDRVIRNMDALCYNEDFGLKVPKKVPDDWSNTQRSYGWTGNADFVPDSLALLQRMLDDESLDLARIDADGNIQLKSAAMWTVLDRCAEINKDLSLICFFANGQNTRIAEFVEHKLRNSTRPRTCFFDDLSNSIWLVTRRLKNKVESFVPLKCPPIVSELLIKYCTIVRPVEEHIAFHARGTEARKLYREYLWVQNCALLQKQTMYNAVPAFLESTINDRIGVHDYRQIVVALTRVFLGSEYESEQEEIDTLAAQSGHSETTARMRYATETGYLAGMSSELLSRFGRSSERWWGVAGLKLGVPPLQPLKTRQGLLFHSSLKSGGGTTIDHDRLPALLEPIKTSMQEMFADMKTSLISEVRDMLKKSIPDPALLETRIVAKTMEEWQKTTTSRMFAASPPPLPAPALPFDDRAILGHDVDTNHDDIYESDVEMQVPSTIETDRPAESTIVSATQTENYLLHLLAQHFPDDPNPSFKSAQQMAAVEMAVSRAENFVLVMPTGSGKSLVFTLPPFNEAGFRTYVIVPNKALLQDHLNRCKKVGLSAFHWRAQHKAVPEDMQIVFIALETATSDTFRM